MVLCNGTIDSKTVFMGNTASVGCVKEGSITLVSNIQGVITQGINCGSAC